MHTAKEYFLSVMGVSVPMSFLGYDIAFQHAKETTPFCLIKTDINGNTFIRFNSWDDEDAVTVFVH